MSAASFRSTLESLINSYSMENGSDTPDYVLAEYLCDCLAAFDRAVRMRSAACQAQQSPMTTMCRHGHLWPACAICHSKKLGAVVWVDKDGVPLRNTHDLPVDMKSPPDMQP